MQKFCIKIPANSFESMHRVLLITPPLTQLNTSYPATSQLTGYLRSQGIDCQQMDLSILLIDRILTREVTADIFRMAQDKADSGEWRVPKQLRVVMSCSAFYIQWVEAVKRFLQGKDLTLQNRFAQRTFWPNAKALPSEEDLEWDYGTAGTCNKAQYLCTRFVEDIGAVIKAAVSDKFEMVRYAEKLCMSLSSFDPLAAELQQQPDYMEQLMLDILQSRLSSLQEGGSPFSLIGFSVPFPGNLLGALRCAQWLRRHYPGVHINMGGGYVNTELRQLTDTRIFDYVDSLCFDDGELPMCRLATTSDGDKSQLVRTMVREGDHVVRYGFDVCQNVPFREIGTPCLEGLPLHLYLDTADTANPMQRIWSNGRWNKLMMAHGCYWAKCSFCDTSLDYIGRYDAAPASLIVDRMENMMQQSGESGFHFVDEAAPPVVLRGLAEEIIRRKLCVNYWTNIRFEKVYSQELCYLMAQSGCVAVSGGIEVASERVLKLINKGVSVASVRETLTHFRDNGIMVHAYLMYGFPSETEQELMESLRTVRDMFADGLIQSAFWHRYAMTCHSPSGRCPQSVGARWAEPAADGETPQFAPFANNEIPFVDEKAPDWSLYEHGLNLATQNFMRGAGFDMDVRKWFR